MKTMPESTIIPVLTYPDLNEAILWLKNILGFKERWRIGDHRAQLTLGNCTIAVTAGSSKHPASLLVSVQGIDDHFVKTQFRGVNIIAPPTDHFYGERQYTIEDIGGHLWTLSETIKDLTPEDWGARTGEAES
jgi:uncharacterized glyoxalase superfamily protein PhnB